MPTIWDNIEHKLHEGLLCTLELSYKADFCVGYFNLRGWKFLSNHIHHFEGGANCCRLLVGMQRAEKELIREVLSREDPGLMDNAKASALIKEAAREFREQLTFGVPTLKDEIALRELKQQLQEGKLVVKLFLRNLHAKLYLLHRHDKIAPLIGYVGSSNLTFSGLSANGELNVDVLEQDAARKLQTWFDSRWNERWSLDITKALIEIIDESWAREERIPPYHVYLKMAYHLSHEARTGISNFIIPSSIREELLPFQVNAVSIAARHLEKRNGVLIGDVVGLGKTLTAVATAKLFEETFYTDALIICPKNLTGMWTDYVQRYNLRAQVESISLVGKNFAEETRRYAIVIIDESHNLRNRHGKKYALVKEYIEKNECKVILLTATPYNKSYLDISSQFRLFISEDKDLGILPERFIRETGGPLEFITRYQYSPSTLAAFEKSPYSEDWQELLKIYMVRRTRSFIKANYAAWDEQKQQYYLTFNNGKKNYLPKRVSKKAEYSFDENDAQDIYVKLYSDEIVKKLNALHLSRYGLGNYIDELNAAHASPEEKKTLANLSRAGKRLMGFCRTNLYKRLESSGYAFLLSVSRQILRNAAFVYAIENKLELPIGQQEAAHADEFIEEADETGSGQLSFLSGSPDLQALAGFYYRKLAAEKQKAGWIHSSFFTSILHEELKQDTDILLSILEAGKQWSSLQDKKLNALEALCSETHSTDKLLIFTQFADTALYLYEQLSKKEITRLACVTGDSENPTQLAQRFSPRSNHLSQVKDEIRILISTDVLSEGQNLQDCHIIINYDLPWALIRLVQRAGRVDRIGQEAAEILCYSFLPQDGLERIIQLRQRLRQRISENAEVVGTDEVFFDGDPVNLSDLYNEKSGIFENEEEEESDLTSQAYEIWHKATKNNPALKEAVLSLPDVVYSTMPARSGKTGVITYHKNSGGQEVLTWIDVNGAIISQSQSRILKEIACTKNTPALGRMENHYAVVGKAVELTEKETFRTGGQLGGRAGVRYKLYGTLERYYRQAKQTLFESEPLKRAIHDIYRYPLKESTREIIGRRLRAGISDEELAELVLQLHSENKLSIKNANEETYRPRIICSLGIKAE